MSRLSDILGGDLMIPDIGSAEEIRIKRGAKAVVRRSGVNVVYGTVTSGAFSRILARACDNSFHTHAEEIKRGYVNAGNGIRIGVSGQAVCDVGKIINVTEIDNMIFRIPHLIRGVSFPVLSLIRRSSVPPNILIFSKPGGGKTTVLRDIALTLCSKAFGMRCAVLDTRGEFELNEMKQEPLLCTLSGYPKEAAFEISVRSLSPDYIISDELGSPEEARDILIYRGSGVSLISTAHASSIDDIKSKGILSELFGSRVYDYYCGIERNYGKSTEFRIYDSEGKECSSRSSAYV